MACDFPHQQIPTSGKTWCASGVIGLLLLTVLVAAANLWVISSKSGPAVTLRPPVLILGILYCLGIPLILFLHGRAFVSIRWDPAGFVMSHYLTPWHLPEAASWSDIQRVKVEVGPNVFDDVQSAITALRKELGRRKLLRSFPVHIEFLCMDGRKISVLPTMLTPRQMLPFLSAAAQYLQTNGEG